MLMQFIKTIKFFVRTFEAKECLSRKCLPIDDEEEKNFVFFNTLVKMVACMHVYSLQELILLDFQKCRFSQVGFYCIAVITNF